MTHRGSLCAIGIALLVLAGLWAMSTHYRREGLGKEQARTLVENTEAQREEAQQAAGGFNKNRGTAREYARLITELLGTLDAELVTEITSYAEARHKQGNSYALMNKHAQHASAINTLRTSCETALKTVQG